MQKLEKGMVVPVAILTFKLLSCVNITKEGYGCKWSVSQPTIKLEPIFLVQKWGGYCICGLLHGNQQGRGYQRASHGGAHEALRSWWGSNSQGFCQGSSSSQDWHGTNPGQGRGIDRKLHPMAQMASACYVSHGSYHRLVKYCPDSYENTAEVNTLIS